MKFPKKLGNVFKAKVTPPVPKVVKLNDMFLVEGEGWIKIIIPMGKKVDAKMLSEKYGKHNLVKLSPCLYRLEML